MNFYYSLLIFVLRFLLLGNISQGNKIKCCENNTPVGEDLDYVTLDGIRMHTPLLEDIKYREEELIKDIQELKKLYEICQQRYHVIISYDGSLDINAFQRIHHHSNLVDEGKLMLYGELILDGSEYTNTNDQETKFQRFFMNFFIKKKSYPIFRKNEGIFRINETKTQAYTKFTDFNSCPVFRSYNEFNKTIILDDFCYYDHLNYQILFKLLDCAFFHKPIYKNTLILSFDQKQFETIVLFEDEMLKLYKSFGPNCINIFYTTLLFKEDKYYQIKMRMTKPCNPNGSLIFEDVKELEDKPVLYKMWPKSLNGTTYDIEHIKIKDKV
ncbi:hypothetical protein COBT_003840, partial [Conglomerata obtusa]